MFLWLLECVFQPGATMTIVAPGNGNDIKAAGSTGHQWVTGEEPACCLSNPSLLGSRNRAEPVRPCPGAAKPYLDKHQHVSIPHDEVDLAHPAVHVSIYGFQTLTPQIGFCQRLPGLAAWMRLSVARRHGADEGRRHGTLPRRARVRAP